ncbi:sugar nucleotide-binding protein [Candidatus Babeliales bacterium]|nr:sugar nucleotide-binding protein [Candidatus Babeliales bacterium]
MRLLVLGSTGMLGQALMKEAKDRNLEALGMADSGCADVLFDICDDAKLTKLIDDYRPTTIINTVALVNLGVCEQDPGLAYRVNTRPAGILANVCRKYAIRLIHISTDHYYTGGIDSKHDENGKIVLLNEYARTKYLAECLALAYDNALVVRTNIVGFRQQPNSPTFVEWALKVIQNDEPCVLFDDFYTSSIDVAQFSKVLFDLLNNNVSGVINLACRDVSSKKDFILGLSTGLGKSLTKATIGSVIKSSYQGVVRAESLGLDVGRAEEILGYQLPTKDAVLKSLIMQATRKFDEIRQ